MAKIEFTPVYLKKIQLLSIQLRKFAIGTQGGLHKSNRKGHGLEFSDIRPYSPGDDFRSVDWNALARTDKLYTKQYREEQDIKILVVNDLSRSMADYILPKQISLSFCYIGLCSNDKVSLLLPEIEQFPWVNSPTAFKKLIEFVESKTPSKDINLGHSIIKATNGLKVPARLFIVSDFLYPIEQVQQALEYATSKNFDTSVIIINTMQSLDLTEDAILVDSETETEFSVEVDANDFQESLNKHINSVIELVRHFGQQYAVVNIDSAIDDVFFKDFIKSGILR